MQDFLYMQTLQSLQSSEDYSISLLFCLSVDGRQWLWMVCTYVLVDLCIFNLTSLSSPCPAYCSKAGSSQTWAKLPWQVWKPGTARWSCSFCYCLGLCKSFFFFSTILLWCSCKLPSYSQKGLLVTNTVSDRNFGGVFFWVVIWYESFTISSFLFWILTQISVSGYSMMFQTE